MKLVVNLKKLRQQKQLTQKDLADKLQIHQVIISKYETGKLIPSLERALELAIALEVTLDDLISYEIAHEKYSEELLKLKRP